MEKIHNINNLQFDKGSWWVFNLATNQYTCSKYLIDICEVDFDKLDYLDFLLLVHPDHKDRVQKSLCLYPQTNYYKEKFPLLTKFGYRWVVSEVVEDVVSENGDKLLIGNIEFLKDTDVIIEKDKDIELRMMELIRRYTSVSDSLMCLLNQSGISTTIDKVLDNLVDDFDGDRAYIFEYNTQNQTQSCVYEVVRNSAPSEKAELQNLPMSGTKWWTKTLYNEGGLIVCSDISELPEEEYEILKAQNIKSLIVAPLITNEGIGGYLGVDMVKRKRKWSDTDKQWFQSIANIISLSIELRKSEDLVRRDRERYMSLYNSMPIGFIRINLIYDSNGNPVDYIHLDMNSVAQSLTPVPSADLIGKSAIGLDDEETFNAKLAFFDELIKTKELRKGNSHLSDFDIYIDYTIYAFEDNEIIALVQDNTASIVATRALRKSEATLNNIYKNIPVGIEIYDKDGCLVSVNDIEREMFGFSSTEEVLGVNLFDNPNVPSSFLDDLKNNKPSWCSFYYDFDKLNRYYESKCYGRKHIILKGSILYDADNNVENYLLIVLDNTEHLRASHKIHEFELLFNSIAEFAEIGLCQWSPCNSTIVGTDQWFANLSIEKREITDIMDAYANAHIDDLVRVQRGFRNIIDGKINSFREEIRIQNGRSWKWLRCSYKVAEYIPEDNIIEIIGVNIDITELKNTEIKLIEAKSRAEESDMLKSAFLANMSHEIRTPLNAIVGFSDLLVDADDIIDRQQYISIIRQNNDLLLQLISDILDISKIESGMLDIKPELIDVNDLCEEIVCSQSVKADEGVSILFEDKEDVCFITSDKNRVRQVLTNLVGNALKFTKNGLISIGYTIKDNDVEFYVSDTGIGIDDTHVNTIFDRFVKLNSFVSGTGLGLSICRSIIEKMGGKIWCESEVGTGSCFKFTLPYEDTNYEMEDPSTLYDRTKQNNLKNDNMTDEKPTILVAEDTDSNYLLVSTILKNEYNLIRAYTGVEAIRLFETHTPKLVLMDMKMPEMDGVEATINIRKVDKSIPIIMLTAFAYDNDKVLALNAGCCDFMTKPIHPSELKSIIKKYIE